MFGFTRTVAKQLWPVAAKCCGERSPCWAVSGPRGLSTAGSLLAAAQLQTAKKRIQRRKIVPAEDTGQPQGVSFTVGSSVLVPLDLGSNYSTCSFHFLNHLHLLTLRTMVQLNSLAICLGSKIMAIKICIIRTARDWYF